MKVILAAGGSGGHIFPSVALARELTGRGVKDIYFVASKRRLDKNILRDAGNKCFFLSENPMPYKLNLFNAAVFAFKLFADAVVSFFIIAAIRPDVVVGFGGYSSGAVVRCAKIFNLPVIIHEQNLVPGRANKLLSKVVDKIAVSFPESSEHFAVSPGRIVHTGNPIRVELLAKDRIEALKYLELSPERKTVLVMGGSQGSTFLNTTVSQAAGLIKEKKGDKVQFVHLAGKKDFEKIKQYYEEKKIPAKVYSFLDRIDKAYSACDIAISRSGAAAIFELAYYAKPMFLVPYPGKKNNQRYNAIYFSRKGAAVYKEEGDLASGSIADEVLNILDDPASLDRMCKRSGLLSNPQAGEKLADEVIKLSRKK